MSMFKKYKLITCAGPENIGLTKHANILKLKLNLGEEIIITA